MYSIKNKLLLNGVLIFSVFVLITAYFIEFILGHQPCNLCLIERIPYGISMILIIIISIYHKNEKFFVLLLVITFIFSLAISIYHFGIEKCICWFILQASHQRINWLMFQTYSNNSHFIVLYVKVNRPGTNHLGWFHWIVTVLHYHRDVNCGILQIERCFRRPFCL